MYFTPNIKQEDSIILPTFKDERIEKFKNEEGTPEKYIDILSSIDIRLSNLKQIILFLTNENIQNGENNYKDFFNEYKINIKAFLTHIFFLKRRINLFLDIYQKKIDINEFIEKYKEPFPLQKQMYEEYNLKYEFNRDFDLFYDLHKEEYSLLNKIKSLGVQYVPNMTTFIIGMRILNLYLNDALTIFKLILNAKTISDVNEEQKLKLCKLLYIIQTCGLLICNLYFLDKDSIFNYKEKNYEWNKIKAKMKRINVSNKANIMDTLEQIKSNILVVYSSMNSLEKHLSNNNIINNSIKGVFMAYYFLRKDKAKKEGNKFMINPDINIFRKIWGLTETKESKNLIKLVLPNIDYRQTFYISRNEYDIINNEVINDLNEKIKEDNLELDIDKSINNDINKKKLFDKEPKLRKRVIVFENENPDSETNTKRSKRFKSKKELKSIKKEEKKLNYIKVILLHNSFIKINLPPENDSFFDKFLCCSSSRFTNNDISKNSIIFHIHGGGFITLSPICHENYLRKIVNKTGIASLSVNYRLSPKYSFPSALDDVYQVYTWLIENGENDLNLKIKNIILLGDSAGGNLILSLVYILLIRGIKLPNLIILAYPAVKMNIIPLSLSYINSIYDPMLNYNLLDFCRRSYLGENNTEDMNPFISPIYMDNKILKNLPKIKIYGGTGDPLRDDYVEFFHKIFKAKVDCEYVEFKYFPHGFLSYDYSFIMPQVEECTKRICEDIENFVNDDLI